LAAVLLWAALPDRPRGGAGDRRHGQGTRRRPWGTSLSGRWRAALLPQLTSGGELLVAGHCDASDPFDAAAARRYPRGMPRPAGPNPGRGKPYQRPYRRRSLALSRTDLGKELYRERTRIERPFGNAAVFGGGLGPLPAWVLGRARARTWVWANLLINGVRIRRKHDLRQPCKRLWSLGTRRRMGRDSSQLKGCLCK
jgi:hypothetical protein